jgi:hypothetical protein
MVPMTDQPPYVFEIHGPDDGRGVFIDIDPPERDRFRFVRVMSDEPQPTVTVNIQHSDEWTSFCYPD